MDRDRPPLDDTVWAPDVREQDVTCGGWVTGWTGDTTGRIALGRAGEDAALAHLEAVHGLRPIARGWRSAGGEVRGELDIVARSDSSGLLVVCEVKTRIGAAGLGGAVAALGVAQQRRIRRLTGMLLATSAVRASGVRLDLVAIDVTTDRARAHLTHLVAAW